MKATGIVRRIDDLGRVVIPKEIRRTLRIREGDPLEIFTDREGEIILKKYSPIGELGGFSGQLADSLATQTGHVVCVTDRDQIIAAAGSGRKELIGKAISKELDQAMEERMQLIRGKKEKDFVAVTDVDAEEFEMECMATILCEGDAIGAVLFLSRKEGTMMGELEKKLAMAAADFLGKQMES